MIINLNLEGKELEKFTLLKLKTGIRADSEVLRFAITQTYLNIVEREPIP